jgi:ubiquinone/menaquinone biosynthesis C-methylase UbiE
VATDEHTIIPAGGRLVPAQAYDAIVAATMREERWRPRIANDIAARFGDAPRIVDVGAGTGSLTCTLCQRMPTASITAVEPDRRTRAIGQAKTSSQGAARAQSDQIAPPIAWVDGHAEALPLADGSQDAAVMALMLHHLTTAHKQRALGEAQRILKPGGSLYVADFGRPHDPLMAAAFTIIQLADGVTTTRDHRAGRLPKLIADTGFTATTVLLRLRTLFGSLEILRAESPGNSPDYARVGVGATGSSSQGR